MGTLVLVDSLLSAFRASSEHTPEALAVIDHDREITYEQLDRRVRAMTALLRQQSTATDRRIGFLGTIGLDCVVTLMGAHQAGVCFVWLDPREQIAALVELIEHGGLDCVVHSRDLAERAAAFDVNTLDVENATNTPLSTSEAFGDGKGWSHIRYTSGSTGRPKGVPISRAQVEYILERLHPTTNTTAADRVGLFGHFWPVTIFEALEHGATLVVLDPVRDGVSGAIEQMRTHEVTTVLTFTALFRQLASAAREPLPSLRLAHLSGEPLRRADIERFERMCRPGSELINSYGSSEYPLIAFHRHTWGDHMDGDRVPLGRPFDPTEVDVVDERGRSTTVDEVGMVIVRSTWLPSGYVGDPGRSEAVFVDDPVTGTRIYRTGDLAHRDARGILHARGRGDDQVKVRGHAVRVSDVEREVATHPGVRECAVVAAESSVGTTLVCRYVTDDGHELSPRDLRSELAVRLAGHMVPGQLWPIDSLPTGANGKLDRGALLDIQRSSADPVPRTFNARAMEIRAMCVDLLGHDAFTEHDDFFDVGGDSLMAMALLEQIESTFGIRIPFDEIVLHGASAYGLAETLERLATREPGHGAEVLRSGSGDSPVLLANLLDGGVSDYLELIRRIDPSEPVIMVPIPRTSPARSRRSLNDLVDSLVVELGSSATPRMIIGYSFGALVAVEMARRLSGPAGAPELILIEPDVSWATSLPGLRHVAHALVERRFAVARGRAALLLGNGRDAPLDRINMVSLIRYRPTALQGCRTLVITAEESHMTDSAARWAPLLGDDVTVVGVPGDHLSVVKPPAVDTVARVIAEWRAQTAG